MELDLKSLSVSELLKLYSDIPVILKEKGVIRTNNILGDLGEYLVIEHYNKTPGLPKLQVAPAGTQNVDALSRKGDRYSIKSTRGNGTGVFYGFNDKNSKEVDLNKFEFVIIAQFDSNYNLRLILEIDWDAFLKHKRWHSRMRAWNLGITKKLIADAKVVFETQALKL